MEADKQKDEIFVRDCPIRNILSRISDKWSILVIFTLEQTAVMRIWRTPKGYSRYFAKDVDGDFEDVGARRYLNRRAYAQIPPKVEYSLTSRGQSLLPRLNALIDWAKEQMDAIMEDRARSGQPA